MTGMDNTLMRTVGYTGLSCYFILVLCLVFYLEPTLRDPKEFKEDGIHIVISLRGSGPIMLAEVLLKSILYFQGRFNVYNRSCTTRHFPQSSQHCPLDQSSLIQNPITFHVLVDNPTKPIFVDTFRKWHRPYLRWRIYQSEHHEKLLDKLRTTHHSGVPSMMKLLVPIILPSTVEKVIVMDTDMLFNHNVYGLWSLFGQFNSSQAIGLSWSLKASRPKCEYFRYYPITDRGVNGGLSLMHLTRLRQQEWHTKWQQASQKFFQRNVLLSQADQDVFNAVVDLNPSIYFRIPCEWNVQLCAKTGPDCCPVAWPIIKPTELDCLTNRTRKSSRHEPNMVKLAHFTGQDKNDYLYANNSSNMTLDLVDERLEQEELKFRFAQAFQAFRAIPSYCF